MNERANKQTTQKKQIKKIRKKIQKNSKNILIMNHILYYEMKSKKFFARD